jgi:hypothetical protein
MEENTIGVANAISGVLIRIPYRQWAHILENHDYMAGNLDLVLETLSDQDFVAQGWSDELITIAVLIRMRYRSVAQLHKLQCFSRLGCTSCVQEPLYSALPKNQYHRKGRGCSLQGSFRK